MALDAQWSAVARGYRFALILAAALGVAAIGATFALGHPLAGLFVCVGLGLGGYNSRRLWTDTEKLTAGPVEASGEQPAGEIPRKMSGPVLTSSARRLGFITVFAFLVALAYRPLGWTVFVGLLAFQVVMVATVAPPLRRVIRP